MTILQFIVTLVGGLGIGSLITTVVNRWLEGRSERARWLRDRRHAAYAALAKELLTMNAWTVGAVGLEEGRRRPQKPSCLWTMTNWPNGSRCTSTKSTMRANA